MLDNVQVLLWSTAYVLMIVSYIWGRKEKKRVIPLVVAISNLGWEAAAVISVGTWGQWLWFALDVVILAFALLFTPKWSIRIAAVAAVAVLAALYLWLFRIPMCMLYSSFVIDLYMAICFLIWRKKLSNRLAISIAVFKLLGSIVAGIHYGLDNTLVIVIAIAVLLCNITDLFLCIEKKDKAK